MSRLFSPVLTLMLTASVPAQGSPSARASDWARASVARVPSSKFFFLKTNCVWFIDMIFIFWAVQIFRVEHTFTRGSAQTAICKTQLLTTWIYCGASAGASSGFPNVQLQCPVPGKDFPDAHVDLLGLIVLSDWLSLLHAWKKGGLGGGGGVMHSSQWKQNGLSSHWRRMESLAELPRHVILAMFGSGGRERENSEVSWKLLMTLLLVKSTKFWFFL